MNLAGDKNWVKTVIIGTLRELGGLAKGTVMNVLATQAESTCYVLH